KGAAKEKSTNLPANSATLAVYGTDPALFGKHPDGQPIDRESLCVRAPAVIEMRLPADLVAGSEFVTTGVLDRRAGAEGSVQLFGLPKKPAEAIGLVPSQVTVTVANGTWTSDNRRASYGAPILVSENSASRKRIEAAFDDFRQLFPAALCYEKIVPIDE